jgi:hypothetical protein
LIFRHIVPRLLPLILFFLVRIRIWIRIRHA